MISSTANRPNLHAQLHAASSLSSPKYVEKESASFCGTQSFFHTLSQGGIRLTDHTTHQQGSRVFTHLMTSYAVQRLTASFTDYF